MSGAFLIAAVFAGQVGEPESGSAVVSAGDPFRALNELIESTSGATPESGSMPVEYESTLALTFGSGQRVHESGSELIESGSGATFGFGSPPPGMYDNPPPGGSGPEAGSGFRERVIRDLNARFSDRRRWDGRWNVPGARPGLGEGTWIESGSGTDDPAARRRLWDALAEEERRVDREIARLRAEHAESGSGAPRGGDPRGGHLELFVPPPTRPPPLGGGFDADDLPPAAVRPVRPDSPPPAGDARVHALLVALGWIAALAAGGFAGYLLGVGRGEERRRRNLEPRQLDLAGEVAETADSLLAAADANEADRFAACAARLRERVGRTAVLLDDRAADAVRRLMSTAAAGPPTDEAGREGLRASYDGLVGALRNSVRGA